jgi:ABC-type glycerol-3-phosphate transport system substrate-binding protein
LRASPQQALAEIINGNTAMALTWVAPGTDVKDGKLAGKLAFTLLPGDSQAYRFATKTWESRGEEENIHVPLLSVSGRMAAVASNSADPRRAQSFVLWLSDRGVSQQVGPHSAATTLFRQSQIATSTRWTGSLPAEVSRQYAEVLASSLELPRAFPGITIPGRADYLSALDKAVIDAVTGKQSPKEALAAVAARWKEITDKLGADSQRRANARSLGQGN